MAIYITGDIHGDPSRLSFKNFPQGRDLTKEDYVIIAGDFGLVWNQTEDNGEKYWLDWLNDRPWTTLFVDGNHENFNRLYKYPTKMWNGGIVSEIRPSVLHLKRGHIFTILDKKILALGGNYSHDIQDGILDPEEDDFREKYKKLRDIGAMFRVKNWSWWEQEVPNDFERKLTIASWIENPTVDFIITHALPASDLCLLYSYPELNEFEKWLELNVRQKFNYKHWYSGHYHIDKMINDKETSIYENIIQIA